MRYTEFWARLEHALGPVRFRVWAEQQVIGALDHRTPVEALDAGVAPQQVWRAVWESLELPESEK